MNNLTVADQMLRSHGPTQLPSGHGESLSGRADGNGPLPHVGQGGNADHLVVVEDHVLVDVVGDADDVVLLAQVGNDLHLLVLVDLAQRIVGVVVDDGFGLLVEHGGQLSLIKLPISGCYFAFGLALKF